MNHRERRFRSMPGHQEAFKAARIFGRVPRSTATAWLLLLRRLFTFVEVCNDSGKPLRLAGGHSRVSRRFAFSRRYLDIAISAGQCTGSRRRETSCARARIVHYTRVFVISMELKGHASERLSRPRARSYAPRNIIATLSRLIARLIAR